MGKRTVEKASADSEKGLFADAQSLKQPSLRCGTPTLTSPLPQLSII